MEKGKTISVIKAKEESPDHPETHVPLWPLMRAPPPKPLPVKSSFSAFTDDDDHEDETEVMKALSHFQCPTC